MALKKTTVNLNEESQEKMKSVMNNAGITQSDFINKCILNVPIVMLGDRKSIAQSFFELRLAAEKNDDKNFQEGVNETCRLLSLLMEKIEDCKP